jgi:LPXTG-motif cell wall-anchored protein
VHDKHLKTKVFDYHVPLLVGGQKAAINGVLFWTGIPKGNPVALFAALPILALLGGALVWWRRRHGHDGEDDDPAHVQEAW